MNKIGHKTNNRSIATVAPDLFLTTHANSLSYMSARLHNKTHNTKNMQVQSAQKHERRKTTDNYDEHTKTITATKEFNSTKTNMKMF